MPSYVFVDSSSLSIGICFFCLTGGDGHGVIQNFQDRKKKEALQAAIQACQATQLFPEIAKDGLWMDHFCYHTFVWYAGTG